MESVRSRAGVARVVHDALDERDEISMRELLARTGLTRQAIQYHLRRLVAAGEIEPVGAGRARRYRRALLFARTFETAGLQEDRVWRAARAAVPELERLQDHAGRIASYAFTEMLNNAIDHSRSSTVRVTIARRGLRLAFAVVDRGVGAFENVRRRTRLEDHVAAIQEISKGKTTTDPERHTGQGIFFTSKSVDWFSLESNGWKWVVDNVRGDQAIGPSDVRTGTAVRFEIDPDTDRRLPDVFDEYSDPETFGFDRSRTVVRLFEHDVPFVSRSEAKRLARNLDRFAEVVVDFAGVEQIGQGFADELFRVWQADHPGTSLLPVNMNPAVRVMVGRALGASRRDEPRA